MRVQHFELPKFVHAVVTDPEGFKPGTYHYVMFLEQFRKVSRYLRKPGSVQRKIRKYEERYAQGDREWPEVDRVDELRDSPDAVLTFMEKTRLWFAGAHEWGHE